MFKLANIQFDVLAGQVEHNLATAGRLVKQAADLGANMICLPELFTTGYDLASVNNYSSGSPFNEIIDQLSNLAGSLKIHLIAGSIPEKKKGKIYNTSFFFNDSGKLIGTYRKRHLFSPMGEDRLFASGQECPVFESSLARVGICICYDLRFPEQFADLYLQGAQIVFIPAQFPHPRLDHWRILLRARAIENYFFVAGCNRIGTDGSYLFCGHSCIISPWGEILAQAGEREMVITAQIDLKAVEEIRAFFNIKNDLKV